MMSKNSRMGFPDGLIPYDALVHQEEYFRATEEGRRILARGANPYGLPCDRIEQEVCARSRWLVIGFGDGTNFVVLV
jgi:hypothetical protein